MATSIHLKDENYHVGTVYYGGKEHGRCFQCDVDEILLRALCQVGGDEVIFEDDHHEEFSGTYLLALKWRYPT